MPPHEQVPEPWLSFLNELDSLVNEPVRMDCIGGFVVTMLYGLERPTADVDVLEIAPPYAARRFSEVALQGGPLHRRHGVYLDQVGVAQPPYEYESRLREMFPGVFRHLRLMALDPYDLALTKLERNIERDRSDVLHLSRTVPFQLDVLRDRYLTEQRPYLGVPAREDLTLNLWIEMIEEDREKAFLRS
ncbi:MAG TPA: DUF6036 family nucleotidyltransferase [Terracidiphilus sp.]|nr:DUF6036 family nucleotidyltransferase [Terracidiphilus sp.]